MRKKLSDAQLGDSIKSADPLTRLSTDERGDADTNARILIRVNDRINSSTRQRWRLWKRSLTTRAIDRSQAPIPSEGGWYSDLPGAGSASQ